MSARPFQPTEQQVIVIDQDGSAFVEACPGAGKTRVMVERARRVMKLRTSGRGIAFLSFTIAAVSELEDRLRRNGLISTPAFPHFIGIVALRPRSKRAAIDAALGQYWDEPTLVQILAYSGTAVPAMIGIKFRELTEGLGLAPEDCPVVAATRRTGANALGHPPDANVKDLSYRLAVAISDFHFAFELSGRKEALEAIHRIMLHVGGLLGAKTYHQHLSETEIEASDWRPKALGIADALRFSDDRFASAQDWLDEARRLFEPLLPADGGTIKQKLKWNADLPKALSAAPPSGHPARTIHSVKGMEFPAVCVVMTTTAKSIVDFLTAGSDADDNEDARKIYVGASRAERMLVIAIPRSQAERLRTLIAATGAGVTVTAL